MLAYIIQRLKDLTGENNHQHGHYMLMLETLSENRELKHTLEEVETMLRETSLQDFPSYNIGHKFGKLEGMLEGKLEGKLETIIEMLAFVDMPIEELAKKLNVPVEIVLAHLNKIKNNPHIH